MTGPQQPPPEFEPELSEIEWLDGSGPTDSGHQPRIPRAAWYVLIGVVVVAVVIALAVSQRSPKRRASSSPTPPTSSRPTTPPTRPTSPTPTPSTTPVVTVGNTGHPLPDVPRGVDLFARSSGTVLRIELATGRITTTNTQLETNGPVSMVPTRHAVLLIGGDPGPALVVPDGRRPRPVAGVAPEQGGVVLPGPDLDHVWRVSYVSPQAELIGVDGRPAGVTVQSGDSSDGRGGLLTHLAGGTYVVRPGQPLQRVTSGALLAVGPTRWLTEECDDQHRCTLDVVDRATGEHHVLKPTSDSGDPPGVISPDGAVAAIVHLDGDRATARLQLVDLTTGKVRNSVFLSRDSDYGSSPAAWTPNSRWLLAADDTGRIVAVDRAGHVRPLTNSDTFATQLALRAQ